MGLLKYPKAHALTMHDGKGSSKQNRKEGYSKPFNDSSGSKTLQIPRRRIREISALIAINQIMKNPHA
jgi:hypothetical protein